MKTEILFGILLVRCLLLTGHTHAQSADSLSAWGLSNNPQDRIPFLKHVGEWYLSKRDTSAIHYFEELVTLSDLSNDPLLKSYAYYRMGVCRYQQNDIDGSSELYFKGLEFTSASSEFDEMRAKLYNAVGWNFGLLGKYENSVKFLRKAESLASQDNPQLMGLILNNKGVAYKNLKHYDSALFSFKKSLTWNRKIGDQRQVRFNLNNIGNVLMGMSKFDESVSYLDEALALNQQAQDTVEIVNNLINLSLIKSHDGLLKAAESQLLQALLLAREANSLDQQRRIYFSLTTLSERLKNYEAAFLYQKEYYKFTDSLYRKNGIDRALELEAKYSVVVHERDLQEAREHVVEQRFYLSMIIGVLLITCVIIFFLVRMIRTRRSTERKLLKLNAEIQSQAEELLRANAMITEANEALEQLVKYRAEVIQHQSKRILHFSFVNSHEIRGPLATLMGLLGLLYDEESPERRKQLIDFLQITSAKLDKIIRSVSRELEKEDLAE